MDSADDTADVSTEFATVGVDVCVQCHDAKGQEWLESRHGNDNTRPGSPNRPGESACAPCHNPLNDGDLIQQAFNTHEPRRDVVGCESCHGGGGRHWGLGPIEFPKPAPAICGECHNNINTVRTHDGETFIFDKWAGSKHAESLRGEDELPCQRCHTNEGALAANVAAYTGDAEELGSGEELGRRAPELIPEDEVTPVSCATCHDVHKAGELRTVFDWDPNENGSNNDQFDLCTSCHVLYNQDGIVTASGSDASGTAPFFHNTSWYRIIATTHYDDPDTGPGPADNSESIIEGYNIRWQSDDPCFDCHGHEFRTNTRPRSPGDDRDAPTIWTEWSSSAHAGHLFQLKLDAASAQAGGGDPADAPRSTATVDAVMSAAVTDATGEGWTHYNWDWTNSRGSCQRCHTATGLTNFLDADINGTEYDPDDNDFSHLMNWTPETGSSQQEVLYCWGCHTAAAEGELRNPGALTLDFVFLDTDEDPQGVPDFVVVPDKGKANVCAACHSGRGNDTSIRTGRSSRFAGHHAPTAGSLYAEVIHTGFEFDGLDYTPVQFFAHDNIETNGDSPESGDGPCVGCHMAGSADHTFEAVERDATGTITAIKNQALCNECHTNFPMSPAILEEEKANFEDTRAVLQAYVNNTIPNYLGMTLVGNHATIPLRAYGALQNSIYMDEEPCIYVHNRFYGKRLMFDSIDWLDNGVINGTITIPADFPEARVYMNADADGVATRP